MNWNEDEVTAPRFGDDITYWWDLDGSDLDFEEEEIEEWESEDWPADYLNPACEGGLEDSIDDDEEFGGRPTW